MLNLFHDFAYSFRLLRKSPAFFLIVVLTIGLGIGVNAAAFNLFNILILRPLPVPQAAEMVRVLRTSQNDSAYHSFSYPNYQDYRERTAEVLDLAAYSQATFTFSRGDVAASNGQLSGPSQEVAGLFASGNYFSILRATMALGQPFSSVQEEKNEVPVAVCSFGFWQSQFGGDPALVGKTIRLNGIIFTVAGVAAKGFSGTEVETPDVWVPIGMQARLTPGSGQISTRGNGWLSVVGRLRENVSMQRAQAAISVTARQLATAYPEVNAKTGVKLGPGVILTPDKQAEFQAIWLLLMAATTLLLVIVCANAASLMITRAVSRAHELALRAALGARRFGLIRLLLTESMSIVTLGGLVGLGLGSWLTSVLMALVRLPSRNAALMNAAPDIRLVGYTAALVLIIGFIFGLVPLAQIRKSAMYGVVQSGSHTLSRAAHGSLVRRVLMVAQIAFCFTLLIGAGLLIRGLRQEQVTEPGFVTKNVVAMSLQLRGHGYTDATAVIFRDQLTEKVSHLPGVKSVSVASIVPLGDLREETNISFPGSSQFKEDDLDVNISSVSPEYFATLEIPLVMGRTFSQEESQGKVEAVIVNEATARKYWPGENVLGKRFTIGKHRNASIVGIVKDTRSVEFWLPHRPVVYTPIATTGTGELVFLIHLGHSSESMADSLRAIVHSTDGTLPISLQTLEAVVRDWVWPSQVAAWAAIALGILATILASLGLYATIAYSVNQRVREIGVRMALGAGRPDVLLLIVKQGLSLSLISIPIGLVGGVVLGNVLGNFLYGVSPIDPATFISVPLLVLLVAASASFIPAFRASRIAPAVALRAE